jgi:type VI protein secretion system component Hcp
MQHVVISNYSVSGGPGDVPVENVSLDYGTVMYEYNGFGPRDGKPATATYEVESGTVR